MRISLKSKVGFSRSYRASIDRVQGITFTVPDIAVQDDAMKKVADYEFKIEEAEMRLEEIAAQRNDIIKKALEDG